MEFRKFSTKSAKAAFWIAAAVTLVASGEVLTHGDRQALRMKFEVEAIRSGAKDVTKTVQKKMDANDTVAGLTSLLWIGGFVGMMAVARNEDKYYAAQAKKNSLKGIIS